MEKTYKPVPDCEALRYKGTKDKPDIKIFVSSRIDLDAQTIDNPLYIPVRCGAVYDNRENVKMIGDDTGDNISEKRMTFCELTVQYWAWKNVEADYYGLCHYRRYISFYDKQLPFAGLKQGMLPSMNEEFIKKYGFLNEEDIREKIGKQDVVVCPEYDIKEDWIKDNPCKNVRESWLKYSPAFLTDKQFDTILNLIKKLTPEYYQSAREYMNGRKFRGFNCFIMKKEPYMRMCEFSFKILEAFEKTLDMEHTSMTQNRAPGYLGEWLFSIFVYHIQKEGKYKIEERQLIGFANTDRYKPIQPNEKKNVLPIVYTLTVGNTVKVATSIRQIIDNGDKNTYYDIILLRSCLNTNVPLNQLRQQDLKMLMSMATECENISIRCYDPSHMLGELDDFPIDNVDEETKYYLPMLPWILPEYKKCVYLDENVLLKSDIAEFAREAEKLITEEKWAVAPVSVLHSAIANGFRFGGVENFKKAKLQDPYSYCSTQLTYLNLEKMRTNLKKKNVCMYLKESKSMFLGEDAFNVILEGKIAHCHQKWNKVVFAYPDMAAFQEFIPDRLAKEQKEVTPPAAVNLLGDRKAWPSLYTEDTFDYIKYVRQTQFYERFLMEFTDGRTANALRPVAGGVYKLQQMHGLVPIPQTGIRNVADVLMPYGSTRRRVAKAIFPKGSPQWNFFKKFFRFFKPVKNNAKS